MATLTRPQIRTLKAVVKGPRTRIMIAKEAFNGNSVNFAPILAGLLKAKLVRRDVSKVDGKNGKTIEEECFEATAAGKKVAASAPADLSRGAGQHKSLPKAGGTFEKTYKGKTVKVTVTADGFRVGAKTYSSLSAAAKAVRGSDQEVNGWAFFGLVKNDDK